MSTHFVSAQCQTREEVTEEEKKVEEVEEVEEAEEAEEEEVEDKEEVGKGCSEEEVSIRLELVLVLVLDYLNGKFLFLNISQYIRIRKLEFLQLSKNMTLLEIIDSWSIYVQYDYFLFFQTSCLSSQLIK